MRGILWTIFFTTLNAPVGAQTLSQEWMGDGVFSAELMRPSFESSLVEFPSVAGFLNLRLPLGSVALVTELPFATFTRSTITGTQTSRSIGNILIGVEGQRGNVVLHGSVRLPTAPVDEEAFFVGAFGDVHRSEAFDPDQLSVKGGINYRSSRENDVNLDVGAALLVLLPDEDAGVVDTEVLIDYGFLLVHRPRALGISGGLSGRALISESDPSFDERSAHEVRLTVDYTTRRVRPFLGATFPLDEAIRDIAPWVLRVGLQVALH